MVNVVSYSIVSYSIVSYSNTNTADSITSSTVTIKEEDNSFIFHCLQVQTCCFKDYYLFDKCCLRPLSAISRPAGNCTVLSLIFRTAVNCQTAARTAVALLAVSLFVTVCHCLLLFFTVCYCLSLSRTIELMKCL